LKTSWMYTDFGRGLVLSILIDQAQSQPKSLVSHVSCLTGFSLWRYLVERALINGDWTRGFYLVCTVK